MTTRDAAGPAARFCASERRTPLSAHSTASNTSNASARERISGKLDERLNDPSRRAPRVFLHVISRIHRLIPSRLRKRVPVTFIGYALINGSAFLIDISFLWIFFDKLHWLYPLAVTLGYMIAGAYSLLLNRWLHLPSPRHRAGLALRGRARKPVRHLHPRPDLLPVLDRGARRTGPAHLGLLRGRLPLHADEALGVPGHSRAR